MVLESGLAEWVEALDHPNPKVLSTQRNDVAPGKLVLLYLKLLNLFSLLEIVDQELGVRVHVHYISPSGNVEKSRPFLVLYPE